MDKQLLAETEEKMKHSVESTRRELATIRGGKATTSLLDTVRVNYYGNMVPLNQTANISAPEPRMLLIQPWEKAMVEEIKKAILKSDLGLNPTDDGIVIRIPIPPLTEERRKDLVRTIRVLAEEGRVKVRGIRREANESLRNKEKDKSISEDDSRKTQNEVQKLTDKYTEAVDSILDSKQKEIMEV
jgi:ribosome recycling factor